MIGKYVVVRCDCAGVFAGTLEAHEGQQVTLRNARKLWYWDGATETLQIAAEGVKHPDNCKFTLSVDSIILQGVIEIIPATAAAEENIKAVRVWKA